MIWAGVDVLERNRGAGCVHDTVCVCFQALDVSICDGLREVGVARLGSSSCANRRVLIVVQGVAMMELSVR